MITTATGSKSCSFLWLKPPAIIPYMKLSNTNKQIAHSLWGAMIVSWNRNRCVDKLMDIITLFLDQYPKRHHAIECTAHCFTALVGINSDTVSEYWSDIVGYIGEQPKLPTQDD
jgi:hypothetical protein